eukprot:TRINITY_DN2414_c0_g1_i1.p1 TRINITY_DN2414_c0_g1~~TRINITY_DN2414_c0_g1_i1.p1  ORF type:complete len:387 (+),score=65.90 TRINITY_DN2414_c0_g1_i1:56-1216(+)
MENAKDFVSRVSKTVSGNLHETDSEIRQSILSTDYEDMDFGPILDFGITPNHLAFVKDTTHKVIKAKDKLADSVIQKRKQLEKAAAKPINIRFQDKMAFTLGVYNMALSMFLLGKHPEWFYLVYTIKFPILLGLRYYLYKKNKWHYFLLDFCYFANFLMLVFLYAKPDSCFLFKLCFAYSTGPLSIAVALWKNSMVFHSLDKITSVYIHLTPALVSWTIRWSETTYSPCDANSTISLMDAIVWPVLIYCLWQLAYYIKVNQIDKHKFENNKEMMTSYRWLTSEKQNRSLIYKLSNIYGKKYQMWWYGIWQLVYTILTVLPIKLFYQSYIAHTAFLLLICAISCWNGANFYIEVFSVRYQQTIAECEKHYETLTNILENQQSKDKKS